MKHDPPSELLHEYPGLPRCPLEVVQLSCRFSRKEFAHELDVTDSQMRDYLRGKGSLTNNRKANRALVIKFGLRPESMWSTDSFPSCLDVRCDSNVPQWILAWRSTACLHSQTKFHINLILRLRVLEANRKIDVINGKVADPILAGTKYDVSEQGLFNVLSEMNTEDALKIIPTQPPPEDIRVGFGARTMFSLRLEDIFDRYVENKFPSVPMYYFTLARVRENTPSARRKGPRG